MNEPWYRDGLRFQCTRCGNCCTGTGGTIRVSEDEIEALAEQLDLEVAQFRETFTRRLRDGAVSLREKSSRECVFYDRSGGCKVYERRPRQCR